MPATQRIVSGRRFGHDLRKHRPDPGWLAKLLSQPTRMASCLRDGENLFFVTPPTALLAGDAFRPRRTAASTAFKEYLIALGCAPPVGWVAPFAIMKAPPAPTSARQHPQAWVATRFNKMETSRGDCPLSRQKPPVLRSLTAHSADFSSLWT